MANNKGGYTCKCKQGQKGKYCDQGETALQKMVEDFDEPFDATNNGICNFLLINIFSTAAQSNQL